MLEPLFTRFVFQASIHVIEPEGKDSFTVPLAGGGHVVVFRHRMGPPETVDRDDCAEPDLFVVKFLGTSGRAERSGSDPFDRWADRTIEFWSVNPPGYGASPGTPSLAGLISAAEAVSTAIRARAGERPVLVFGNSLGTIPALYAASTGRAEAVVLRNPLPLLRLIRQRCWWNAYLFAALMSRLVPAEANAEGTARLCSCPALFLTSGNDELIPPRLQHLIVEAYAGPLRHLVIAGISHGERGYGEQEHEFQACLRWLEEQLVQLQATRCVGPPSAT